MPPSYIEQLRDPEGYRNKPHVRDKDEPRFRYFDEPRHLTGCEYVAQEYALDSLWFGREDPSALAAVLTVALLESEWDDRNRDQRFDWRIKKAADSHLEKVNVRIYSDGRSRNPLPNPYYSWRDHRTRVRSSESLADAVRAIANVHADLLNKKSLLSLRFVGKIPEDLIEESRRRRAAREKAEEEWRLKNEAASREREERAEKERAAQREYYARMRAEHPRFGEWRGLSDDELAKLVWEKPTLLIAKDFGISDVAIGKRCDAHGISKPPRGCWAKQKAKDTAGRDERA